MGVKKKKGILGVCFWVEYTQRVVELEYMLASKNTERLWGICLRRRRHISYKTTTLRFRRERRKDHRNHQLRGKQSSVPTFLCWSRSVSFVRSVRAKRIYLYIHIYIIKTVWFWCNFGGMFQFSLPMWNTSIGFKQTFYLHLGFMGSTPFVIDFFLQST